MKPMNKYRQQAAALLALSVHPRVLAASSTDVTDGHWVEIDGHPVYLPGAGGSEHDKRQGVGKGEYHKIRSGQIHDEMAARGSTTARVRTSAGEQSFEMGKDGDAHEVAGKAAKAETAAIQSGTHLATEHFAPAPPQPKTHHLELEQIGSSRPWVAKITGTNEKYGLDREFVNGSKDYSGRNIAGSRGTTTHFDLHDGVYEVNSPESWKRTDRHFLRVKDGQGEKIDAREAMEHAKAQPKAVHRA